MTLEQDFMVALGFKIGIKTIYEESMLKLKELQRKNSNIIIKPEIQQKLEQVIAFYSSIVLNSIELC